MRNLALPVALAFFCAALQGGFAQQPPAVGVGRAGGSPRELLKREGIELTEPALINALRNPSAHVRFLAAIKLAEDKALDAVPAIKDALTLENDPRAHVNMALALGLLGDQAGIAELKSICADENFVPEFRLYAVHYMFDLHVPKDEDCLHAAEEIVEIVDSQNLHSGDRILALGLLVRFQDLTPEESRNVLRLVAGRLQDPDPSVRMTASQSLGQWGNVAAVPYLKAAIAKEHDENVRSVFDKDLKKLQVNPKP